MKGLLFWGGPGKTNPYEIEVDPRTPTTFPYAFSKGRFRTRHLARFLHRKILKRDAKLMLDIGAHIGGIALLAAFHPDLEVWAFEPLPDAFDVLCRNVELNGLGDRIFVSPRAVLDRAGQSVLKVPLKKKHLGSSTLGDNLGHNKAVFGSPDKYRTLEVECCRLDDLPWPKPVDLMKIDAEGAELLILRGGEAMIREYRPALLLEYVAKGTKQFGYKPKRMRKLLQSWGYQRFESLGANMWVTWR